MSLVRKASWIVFAFLLAGALPSQAQVPPPNDNLANAQPLLGPSGSVTGTNLYATAQPGEPAPVLGNPAAASIWYVWTAPDSTTIDFNTRGSTDPLGNPLYTVLAVYKLKTGANVAFTNMTRVASDAQDPSLLPTSRVDFPATLGTTYFIQVDGSSQETGTNAQGYIQLNWGNSLVAGTFSFSTQTFPIGSLDDFILDGSPAVNPSLVNGQGGANVRITVTRNNGFTGRCEVGLVVGAAYYSNLFTTNFYVTNIYITNFLGNTVLSFTNIYLTNFAAINLYEDNVFGTTEYLPYDSLGYIAWTNSDGLIPPPFFTNLPVAAYGLPNFFTNFSCPAPPNPASSTVVNADGSTTYTLTEVFCTSNVVTNVSVSATAGVHYTPLVTNLTFDDFQMSQDVYIPVYPYLSTLALPPGLTLADVITPGAPGGSGGNAVLNLTLTNAVLDPQETLDIVPPTIAQSNAQVNLLNYQGGYTATFTNVPFGVYINFERANFRVDKNVGVVSIPVQRTVRGVACVVNYTVDSGNLGNTVIDYNTWATAAAADYAIPFDPFADGDTNSGADFHLPTNSDWNGIYGQLTFPLGDLSPQYIIIPILTNGAVEFDEDILLQLFLTPANAMSDAANDVFLGNITQAHLTISFDDTTADLQPGGAVDRTYNVDAVYNSFPPNNQIPGTPSGQVNAAAMQTNGLAVIGGEFTDYDTQSINYVARVLTNGFLDPSFSNLGSGPNNYVNAVTLDAAGRIIIGGNFTAVNGTNAFYIARLNPDGSLDPTLVTGFGFNGFVRALAVDTNGNILVGGDFTSFNTTNCNHIARLLPTGGLDTSFAPSSGVTGFGTDQTVRTIALDSNGNVVLGGDFANVNGVNWNHLARLLPTGAVDPSFNPGPGADGTIYALAVQTNNEIVFAGAFQNYNLTVRSGIARAAVTGQSDTGFNPGTGANDVVYSLALQTNGCVLVGGQFTAINGSRRVGIARLLPQGWVDTSFMDTAYNQFAGVINRYYNTNAYNPADFPLPSNYRNQVLAIALEPAGNVIIGGSFSRVGGGFKRDDVHVRMNVARLIGTPTTGPQATGGIGNDPGNITLTQNPYTADDFSQQLFVTLDRTNGSLGPATLSLGTNTLAPGPGAAGDNDFGLLTPVSTYADVWNNWRVSANAYGWRKADGYYGFNNNTQTLNDDGQSALYLSIHNDTNALQNLFASLALLNLNSYGLLNLGGVQIPLEPALGVPTAPLEIINDNYPPGVLGFAATNYTVTDTAGSVTITVLRTNGSSGNASVHYSAQQGFTNGAGTNVAVPGTDFGVVSGTLDFPGGTTSNGFTVQILDHSFLVPTKFFNVVLTSPVVANLDTNGRPPILPSTAVVEIVDGNFQPGHLEFSAPSYSVLKGSPATVTVNRVGGSKGVLTVAVGTSDITASNGINYIGVTNQLTFQNGSITPQTVTIQTLQDNVVEGPKTLSVALFNATNQGVSLAASNNLIVAYPSNAVLTIQDTDSNGNFSFSVPNYTVLQNAGEATITVVRTGGTYGSASINYGVFNGTNAQPPFQPALAGTNYGPTSGTLYFGPGITSQSFVVPIYYTPNESTAANRIVDLVLLNGSPQSVSNQFPQAATLTIEDNQLVLSPAGSVDQTTADGTGFNNSVESLALQPNGAILAGGDFTAFNQYPFNYVGRLNADGSYDNTFLFNLAGANGTVNQVLSLAPGPGQTNGNAFIVGAFSQVNGVNEAGVARLDLDGTLDTTFNPGSGADNIINAAAEQIVAGSTFYVVGGGFANFDGYPAGGVARLTQSGTLDPNFNLGAGASESNTTVRALAIDANNRILVGGDFTSFDNQTHHHLVRLNIDGSLDSNFLAFDGVSSEINGSVRAIVLQPDGEILIGGSFTNVNGGAYNAIARLNTDGTVDTNFNVGAGCDNTVLAIALDSQNNILVGGEFSHASGVTRNAITRLNPNGTVDPSINFGFGANGYIDAIVVQENGEIDVAGGFTMFDNVPANNFARLYGGANSGDGSIEFSQPVYGVLENSTNALITIERIGGEGTAAQPTVTAVFYTTDGTAVNGTNYIGSTNTITFPLGQTFETVSIPIIYSNIVGGNTTVNLNLANSAFASLGPQVSAQLIITNVNTALAFSASGYGQSANAPSGYASIPIVRQGNPNSTVAVTVSTGTNGTAVAGVNYLPATNTLVFAPGVLTMDFLVRVLDSQTTFSDTTVNLQIDAASNAVVGAPSSAVLTIGAVVNAPGVLAFSQTNYVVSEGAVNAAITIIRTNGSLGPVSVTLTTSNLTATAGVNYLGVNTNVNFGDGETSQTIEVPIIQLSNAVPNATVLLTLSNPQGGASIGGLTQETLTIVDDIPSVSFGASTYFVNEGAGVVTLTILLQAGSSNADTSVSYLTYSPTNAADTNGLAVPNVDYVPTAGTVTFVPGQTFQTIPITIIQGTTVNSLETFQVVLTNATPGVQLGVPSVANVGIVSDVTGFAFGTNAYFVGENGGSLVVYVDRINPNAGAASVQFSTSDGTALQGVDYGQTNGTLTFANGQSVASFVVPILNPNMVESNKTFNLLLSSPSSNSYVVSPSNAVVTITNVYTGVSFGSASFTVSECAVAATIPVVLTGLTNNAVSVSFATSDGSGTAGVNYLPNSGQLTFQAGQTVQTFTVTNINNHLIGPDHTVNLSLTQPFGAQLLNPSAAQLTIQECNGAYIVQSGTAFLNGTIQPDTGVVYSNDTVTLEFGLRDVAGGGTTNLVATLLPTNGITNVSAPQNYGALVQYGPTVARPFTFTAIGTNGQNMSAVLSLQDGPANLGEVVFGFTLGGAVNSFTNPATIIILDSTNPPTRASNSIPPGYGYPSTLDVSGVAAGVVTKVTLTLTNFGHQWPHDVDILLESPDGTNSIVFSKCGIGFPVNEATLTFDQSASAALPLYGLITSGTYHPTLNPTNVMAQLPPVRPGVVGVPGAPERPYTNNFDNFVGGPPNGTWALWVVDTVTLDAGYISNGWILNISSGQPIESDSDLGVTVSASPAVATVSNVLTYSITVTNYGPAPATNVVITDPIPAGTFYLTNANSCDCASVTDGVLSFTVPTLAVGAGTAFEVQIVPTNLLTLTNIVTALANEPDPNSNNIITTVSVVGPPSADVGVTMTGSPNPTVIGSDVTYVITVTNGGPSTAASVTAVDVLPAGFVPLTITPTVGTVTNLNGVITWNVGDLSASASGVGPSLTIVAEAAVAGVALNSVSVSSPVFDPLKVNNYAAVKTSVGVVALSVNLSGGVYTLTWPAGNGFVLQGAVNLPPQSPWVSIAAPPVINGQSVYTLPGNNGYHFFRLTSASP